MLHRGVPQPIDSSKVAIMLVIVMLLPIFTPVNANDSVGRNDFGVLEAMADALETQRDSGEDELARNSAEGVLSALEARGREISDGDALLATDGVLGDISMRETEPLTPSHPRPYVYLTDPDSHPDGWPNNLLDTLFELPPSFNDPLAFGANTYSLYVNYTARNNGPQYEAWDYGTFTGDILSFEGAGLFENAIDIDGDGSSDVAVGLSILGLGNRGEGWDIVLGDGPLPTVESIWIRPNFQWRVRVLDHADPLWDDMASMEVSLMKGVAYDLTLTGDGESYALVIDSRFTQPPHDFQIRVGLDQMTLDVTGTFVTLADILNIFGGGDDSGLEITSVSAPYAILVSNPNRNSANEQTDCQDSSWYNPILDHDAESRSHKCGYSIGIGYVHFDEPELDGYRPLDEIGYIDVGLHPTFGNTEIPEELDLVIRNDNAGENSFDNIEIFSDTDADLYFHYFEDRSKHIEEGGQFGNITDSRGWVRDMPKGTLPQEEIDAIFTLIGEAPGSSNLPGQMPNRLSLIISIKNYTADTSANVVDPTLVLDPSDNRWNSLILIAGTERISKLEYVSTFQRHGYASDSSSMEVEIIDLPEVIAIFGTFEIPTSNRVRVEFGTAPDLLSEVLDNVVLNLVEIILDLGTILNGLPEAIVGTAGDSSGEIFLQCFNQVRASLSDGSTRAETMVGSVKLAIGSSQHPVMDKNHILLSEDLDYTDENGNVDGKYGRINPPLVPVGMSVKMTDISGASYSYDQNTDLRTISISGSSGDELVIGHLRHLSNSTEGDVRQFASISNRPANLTIAQQGSLITYSASDEIGTITYSGEGNGQYNALRLNGLPSEFELELGDTLSMSAPDGVGSIEVQISNATVPLTMDDDHARFWIDQVAGEASMSLKLSNLTSIRLEPPQEPGATGERGNSKLIMNRSQSSAFSVLLEDVSDRSDEFLGLSGRIHIDPLPANLEMSLPSSENSELITIPEFGDADGILALSFFLSGMIDFGSSVNDFAVQSMVNLGDASNLQSNLSLGMDLSTDEEFDITLDVTKGKNVPDEPRWVHGISGEVLEVTELKFNYSRMPEFTESSRKVVSDALIDFEMTEQEKIDVIQNLEWAGLSDSESLVAAMEDGFISPREQELLDTATLEEEGVTFDQRRSWHSRIWLPQLPAGKIEIGYEVVIENEIPEFIIQASLEKWTPFRPVLTIELNGLARTDTLMVLTGLNTNYERNLKIHSTVQTQAELLIPRTTITLDYDLEERLENARVVQNNHLRGIRTEMMIFDVPASGKLFSTIGDILQANLTVPVEDRLDGIKSAESMMLQQLRKIDGLWWPATMFIRDVPGEMYLVAAPANNFDIHEEPSFQGMFELDYGSNSDDMDLFIETKGKAQNIRGDTLMLSENLPDKFTMQVTEDYGASISASGNGVEQLYIRRSNTEIQNGVTMVSAEMVGEDLKSAEVHIYRPLEYPVIVVDGITGGRIVATAHTEVEFLGYDIDARGVLLDAQFTGGIPTASSVGVNGVVTDLSLISSLTGGEIETTHVMVGDPFSSLLATAIAVVTG
tara:strand:- start:1588 stop:6219 length:4632 start_codon:yes stop_codon:yes gene_type:complete